MLVAFLMTRSRPCCFGGFSFLLPLPVFKLFSNPSLSSFRTFNRVRTVCHEEAECLLGNFSTLLPSPSVGFDSVVPPVAASLSRADVVQLLTPWQDRVEASLAESRDLLARSTPVETGVVRSPRLDLLHPYVDLPVAPVGTLVLPVGHDPLVYLAGLWCDELDRMLSCVRAGFVRMSRRFSGFPDDLRELLLE